MNPLDFANVLDGGSSRQPLTEHEHTNKKCRKCGGISTCRCSFPDKKTVEVDECWSCERKRLGESEVPRFKKVPRDVFDLACPHCESIMGEKDFSFRLSESAAHMWEHRCLDGVTRLIRPTEEQEEQSASFSKWLNA